MRKLNGFVALGLAIVVAMAGGQAAFATPNPSDGTLDTTFNGVLGGGTNIVTDSVMQPDGKVLLVGNFLTYNGVNAKYVVRINSDGTIDTTFNAGTSAAKTTQGGTIQLKTVALQPDGKILVGGAFDSFQGHVTQALARLNADGTVDTTYVSPVAAYNMSTNPNVAVQNVAVQNDGSVVVVGSFAQALDSAQNPVTVNGAIRTSAAGVLDTVFTTNFGGATIAAFTGSTLTGAGPNAIISALKIQSDGKILIGGTFTLIGGLSGSIRRGMARLLTSGAVDPSFDAGLTGVTTSVYDLTVDANNNVLAAGAMSGAGSTASAGIVRLLGASGAYDSTFSVGTGVAGALARVSSVTVAADGSIYIGGLFLTYNGVSRVGLARVSTSGSLDTTFAVGAGFTYVPSPTYGNVNSIIELPSGDVLAAGLFDAYAGTTRTGIALLTSTAAIAARTAPSNSNSSSSSSNSSSSNSSSSSSSSNSSSNSSSSGSSSNSVGSGSSAGSSVASGSAPVSTASPSPALAQTGTAQSAHLTYAGVWALLTGIAVIGFQVARRRRTQ